MISGIQLINSIILLNSTANTGFDFWFLTLYGSNSNWVGLAELLTRDLVTKDHPSSNRRRTGLLVPTRQGSAAHEIPRSLNLSYFRL